MSLGNRIFFIVTCFMSFVMNNQISLSKVCLDVAE